MQDNQSTAAFTAQADKKPWRTPSLQVAAAVSARFANQTPGADNATMRS